MLKKIVASMALAMLVAAMSLAHADALDEIKKAGKIRIAIDLGVPPYGMTDEAATDRPRRRGGTASRQGLGTRIRARADHRRLSDSRTSDRQGRPRDLEPLLHGRAREGHRFLVRLCRAANGHRPEIRRPQVAGRSRREDRRDGAWHDARHAADKRGAESSGSATVMPRRPDRSGSRRRNARAPSRRKLAFRGGRCRSRRRSASRTGSPGSAP